MSTGFVGGQGLENHPGIYPTATFGHESLIDSPIMYDAHANNAPDLAVAVPIIANGGSRMVRGDEVVTIHLQHDPRWSDGSPITPADYLVHCSGRYV
jgi:ABC-type transport system substrate-binding protein